MKRTIVKNNKEFIDWINAFNGKMNCYTTVYDFELFTPNAKVEDTVIVDRMFLDFDAHGKPLSLALEDTRKVVSKLNSDNVYHEIIFSGKGFHVMVYGERANDIRSIQRYFTELAKDCPTLDSTGIQTNRLRRIPNTVNLSSSGPYFCVPITHLDLKKGLMSILNKAKKGHEPLITYGNEYKSWPSVKPIEISDIEIESPKSPGNLPIIPCLYNSIMVENPGHFARVYLVQWYRDILSMGEREITVEKQEEIIQIIMKELETIASNDEVWMDWNKSVTEKHVRFAVNGGYHAPSCKGKLIPQGYCIGKCWRYSE